VVDVEALPIDDLKPEGFSVDDSTSSVDLNPQEQTNDSEVK
jgi:hypothetical protein